MSPFDHPIQPFIQSPCLLINLGNGARTPLSLLLSSLFFSDNKRNVHKMKLQAIVTVFRHIWTLKRVPLSPFPRAQKKLVILIINRRRRGSKKNNIDARLCPRRHCVSNAFYTAYSSLIAFTSCYSPAEPFEGSALRPSRTIRVNILHGRESFAFIGGLDRWKKIMELAIPPSSLPSKK